MRYILLKSWQVYRCSTDLVQFYYVCSAGIYWFATDKGLQQKMYGQSKEKTNRC